MEQQKKKFSPWIITVILGVIAILFSVFGFQQQSELQDAKQMIVQLREEVMLARREAEKLRELATTAQRSSEAQALELEKLQKECAKKNLKK